MKRAHAWGRGEAGARITKNQNRVPRVDWSLGVGLLWEPDSRADRTLGKGGEDQPGPALPGSAWGRLPLLTGRLRGATAGLHAAASASRYCLCNKCHVCILAHHPQWPAP